MMKPWIFIFRETFEEFNELTKHGFGQWKLNIAFWNDNFKLIFIRIKNMKKKKKRNKNRSTDRGHRVRNSKSSPFYDWSSVFL